MLKPLLEKFLSSGEVEVLRIQNEDFTLRKINTKQAEFLNGYYDYFFKSPEEFLPFLNAVLLDSEKEKLKRFLYQDNLIDYDKLRTFIYAICIQSLSIRPLSLDYTLSNTIYDILENSNIIQRFVFKLISYGYKKSEIDDYSNNKIIRLALEEMFIRDKAEYHIFLANFITEVGPKIFPLSYKALENLEKSANELRFSDENSRANFLKDFYLALNKNNPNVNSKKVNNVKMKTADEIRKEISEKQKKMFANLPK